MDGRLKLGGGVEHGMSFWGGPHDVTGNHNLSRLDKALVTRGAMVGVVGASLPSVVVPAVRGLLPALPARAFEPGPVGCLSSSEDEFPSVQLEVLVW